MKALRTRHADVLDQPHRWDRYLRPWFDAAAYQERINQRVGTNKDGQDIIRIEWAQDAVQHAFKETTPRYWLKRQRQSDGSYTYWTVARWVFTKRLEPEQYVDSWEESRWATRDENGVPIDKGPAPEEWYTYFMECAVHEAYNSHDGWPQCCTRAFYSDSKWGSPRSRCWGTYRAPNDLDLEVLSQSVRKMESEKFQNPYRQLTAAELAEIELAANMQVERAAEQFAQMEREMQQDFNRLHAHILFNEPSPIHDMSPRPSGIIAPAHLNTE